MGRKGQVAWNKKEFHLNKGYPEIYVNGKKKLLHRLTMEKYLGRELKTSEIVHHINHDILDFRIENLQLFSSTGQHTLHGHQRVPTFRMPAGVWGRTQANGKVENLTECNSCKKTNMPHYGRGYCYPCYYQEFRHKIIKRVNLRYHQLRI